MRKKHPGLLVGVEEWDEAYPEVLAELGTRKSDMNVGIHILDTHTSEPDCTVQSGDGSIASHHKAIWLDNLPGVPGVGSGIRRCGGFCPSLDILWGRKSRTNTDLWGQYCGYPVEQRSTLKAERHPPPGGKIQCEVLQMKSGAGLHQYTFCHR